MRVGGGLNGRLVSRREGEGGDDERASERGRWLIEGEREEERKDREREKEVFVVPKESEVGLNSLT